MNSSTDSKSYSEERVLKPVKGSIHEQSATGLNTVKNDTYFCVHVICSCVKDVAPNKCSQRANCIVLWVPDPDSGQAGTLSTMPSPRPMGTIDLIKGLLE